MVVRTVDNAFSRHVSLQPNGIIYIYNNLGGAECEVRSVAIVADGRFVGCRKPGPCDGP